MPRDIMVDIETLSLAPNATILSIGAIAFDPATGDMDEVEFYVNCDPMSQDRDVSMDTISWWMEQPEEVQEALASEQIPLNEALVLFSDWLFYQSDNPIIWSHSFDKIVLQDAYAQCGLDLPWHYRDERDLRTLDAVYDLFFDKLASSNNVDKMFVGTPHIAIDDARNQAERTARIAQILLNLGWNDA